jgi:hypothetical protein
MLSVNSKRHDHMMREHFSFFLRYNVCLRVRGRVLAHEIFEQCVY